MAFADLPWAATRPTSIAMRWPFILLVLAVAGCAGKDGTWPTLARRPIEGPRPVAQAATTAAPPASAPATTPLPASAITADIGDIPAQLATVDRDAANLGTRISEQRAAAATAASAARGTKADSEQWAKAQLELTRLERLGNQLTDLRGKLDGIAGTLAAAAAGGTDVGQPLTATGTVIGRVDALVAAYDADFAKASTAATP